MFYNAVTKDAVTENDHVTFWGMDLVNTELYSYVIAASFIVVMILSPILSGIADGTGSKKMFLRIFCYLGGFSCAALYFFDVNHLEWSMVPLLLSSVGYWGSIVFYNAYLPEIAPPEEHDKLSARGFSMGYIGSVILLLLNLGMVMGIEQEAGNTSIIRLCFILVAIWWIGFAQITLNKMPRNPYNKSKGTPWRKGFEELGKAFRMVKSNPLLKRYLMSFFVFSMAVQTVMLMAQFFGMKEVTQVIDGEVVTGLTTPQFIIAILLIQLIAIPGAYLFSNSSGKYGNVNTLKVALMLWVAVCLCAFLFVDTPMEFYIAAGWIGFIMGGTQS
ncbi:MAG: MFS transporter, partial [Bacteroidota bacterium]